MRLLVVQDERCWSCQSPHCARRHQLTDRAVSLSAEDIAADLVANDAAYEDDSSGSRLLRQADELDDLAVRVDTYGDRYLWGDERRAIDQTQRVLRRLAHAFRVAAGYRQPRAYDELTAVLAADQPVKIAAARRRARQLIDQIAQCPDHDAAYVARVLNEFMSLCNATLLGHRPLMELMARRNNGEPVEDWQYEEAIGLALIYELDRTVESATRGEFVRYWNEMLLKSQARVLWNSDNPDEDKCGGVPLL